MRNQFLLMSTQLKMTSPIKFFCQEHILGKDSRSKRVSSLGNWEVVLKCQICDNGRLKSDQASKWDLWACAEDKKGFCFNFKMLLMKFCSEFAGIIKKVILFFISHRYKEFNPAETSEISEFWWLYSTSHKKISPKYLLVGFSQILYIDLGFQPHQI